MTKEKYLRIGTHIYKEVEKPLPSGKTVSTLMQWSYETLRQDYGKEYIGSIPKYDGFCIIPSHLDYKKEIGTFLNLYEPLSHTPEEGDCPAILSFIEHIFHEHYELGLDYIQLLYTNPTIKLPVLLLVSTERNTGKSTFLNLLKAIFGKNMTFNTNEDFRSQFNTDWINKLIIGVDETLLNRIEDTERIKNLSTSFSHKVEGKGKDRAEVEFFGKFIFCSNNENNAIYVETGETRFWVRKVTPFEKDDPMFLSKLIKEIPAFLHFLKSRTLSTEKESRMWFRHDLLQTDALKRMISYNRSKIECELRDIIFEVMESQKIDHFEFCIKDLISLFGPGAIRVDQQQLKKVVQSIWNLEPKVNNSYPYVTYQYDFYAESGYTLVKRKGRYYSISKEKLSSF
ncbi:DUF5906 domain-containing protein [Parabacteroides sp. OttesenSCG-928-J18]|nr:DUF5906 domain-containing protein [Parabacteroides sp. OttesenSCG-928-O15]MDL2244459.1 DUF5906 domain-containing protein [Parabacteroides sp. OttesenSCG-928-J18]